MQDHHDYVRHLRAALAGPNPGVEHASNGRRLPPIGLLRLWRFELLRKKAKLVAKRAMAAVHRGESIDRAKASQCNLGR